MVVLKNGNMNFKTIVLGLFIVGSLISTICASPTTITAPPTSYKNTVTDDKDDLRKFLGHCLHKGNVSKCLKNRIVDLIDEATTNNDEWKANFFNMRISLNKNPDFKDNMPAVDESRTFEDIISKKLKNLMESRVVQVKLSDEDSNDENKNSNEEASQGRKKKDGKHGNHMMMMSGMAVMAMMIQVFLSKVAFLSGAALLIAKIALLLSTLSGLKKSGGSGGSEHVVYTGDISKQGWQRSIQTITPTIPQPQLQHHADEDLAYRGHPAMTSYDGV